MQKVEPSTKVQIGSERQSCSFVKEENWVEKHMILANSKKASPAVHESLGFLLSIL